jgi:hypothetical protein
MTMSLWAVERFGHLAEQVAERIPRALAATVTHATDAHEASTLRTRHAFGSTRWAVQYEELCRHLGDLDGVQEVRPPRAFFRLVVLGGNLLLPWRYAEDRGVSLDDPRSARSMRMLTKELLTRFGPAPPWRQGGLFDLDLPGEDPQTVEGFGNELADLDPAPRPVLIAYACNPDDGLLDIQWGDASLDDAATLRWLYREPLPIPSDQVTGSPGA